MTTNPMIDPVYSIAMSTAFLGSGHCIGMCGPVVAALSLRGRGLRQGIVFHLFYNLGRITTYTLIGIIAGWLGALLNRTAAFALLSQAILILADLVIIAMGLATTGLFSGGGIIRLEFPAAIRSMTRAVTGLQRLPAGLAALPMGMVMGLLPCGFLYAIALAAAGRGDPLQGGLIMFSFGLGTLPSLFLFGTTVHWLTARSRREMLRWAGLLVIGLGCYNLFQHARQIIGP